MDIKLTQAEITRFRAKFAPAPSGCMEWTGEKNSNGYGRFAIWRERRRIRLLAHRLAFSLVRDLSDGQVVRHSCDNPPCGNPEHLMPGTQADNMRDAAERSRLVTEPLAAYRAQRDAAARARLTIGRKTCRACRVEKALDDFGIHRGNRDGRQYDCRACRSTTGGMSEQDRRKHKKAVAA